MRMHPPSTRVLDSSWNYRIFSWHGLRCSKSKCTWFSVPLNTSTKAHLCYIENRVAWTPRPSFNMDSKGTMRLSCLRLEKYTDGRLSSHLMWCTLPLLIHAIIMGKFGRIEYLSQLCGNLGACPGGRLVSANLFMPIRNVHLQKEAVVVHHDKLVSIFIGHVLSDIGRFNTYFLCCHSHNVWCHKGITKTHTQHYWTELLLQPFVSWCGGVMYVGMIWLSHCTKSMCWHTLANIFLAEFGWQFCNVSLLRRAVRLKRWCGMCPTMFLCI